MNTITIAGINRRGMAALAQALLHGTATILKRNRPAAVVLTPETYKALVTKVDKDTAACSAIDWLPDDPKIQAAVSRTGTMECRAKPMREGGLRAHLAWDKNAFLWPPTLNLFAPVRGLTVFQIKLAGTD